MLAEMSKVDISEHAAMQYSTLRADDRRQLDAWFGHLKNWNNDEVIRAKSKRLESNGETYFLRTGDGFVIAFSVVKETVNVLSIFSEQTVDLFSTSAARRGE